MQQTRLFRNLGNALVGSHGQATIRSCCTMSLKSRMMPMMTLMRMIQCRSKQRDFSTLQTIVLSSVDSESSSSQVKITGEQLKAALERKRVETEHRIENNKKQEKERRKERNREFFKWVGLFSALFFGIMAYHLVWLWAPEIEGALKDSLIYYFRDSKILTQLFLTIFDETKKMTHRTHLENVMATLRTSIRVANSGTFIQEFGTLQTCKCLLELVSTNQLTETIGQIYQQKVNEEDNDISKLAFKTLNSFLKHLTHHPEIMNNVSYLILNGKEENLEMFIADHASKKVESTNFDILDVLLSNCQTSLKCKTHDFETEKDEPYMEFTQLLFSNSSFINVLEKSQYHTVMKTKLGEWANSNEMEKKYLSKKITSMLSKSQ